MEHFYKSDQFSEDWFSFQNLYTTVVESATDGSTFVEVGCYEGRSSAYMCVEIANSDKQIDFFCVDFWQDGLDEVFNRNMKQVENYFTPMHMPSHRAAEKFDNESLDFVFIDADHAYESVKRDINSWWPKVKPGGILAGHDYYPHRPEWGDVYRAVQELFTKNEIHYLYKQSCFKIIKNV